MCRHGLQELVPFAARLASKVFASRFPAMTVAVFRFSVTLMKQRDLRSDAAFEMLRTP
jgi:hypothetical protein